MDPLHLTIALGPVALYLMLLGFIHLAPFTFVSNGLREGIAITIAISGLVMVGPMELFIPEIAFTTLGPFAWMIAIGFYGLSAMILVFAARPRLIIYNISGEKAYVIIHKRIQEIDPEARWAGNSVHSPKLGIQLNIEISALLQNVQLLASCPRQNLNGWRFLEVELATEFRAHKPASKRWGIRLLGFAAVLIAMLVFQIYERGDEIAATLQEMLRL